MTSMKLGSSDGQVFSVGFEVAMMSATIRAMIDDLGMKEDEDKFVILPNVRAEILEKVIQWASHHKNDPPGLDDDVVITAWHEDFFRDDPLILTELIIAADYLGMTGLRETACKAVANLMKGKTAEAIRKMFNVENDFTADEEEQLKRETEWCKEVTNLEDLNQF